jgi:hypothetical protein
MSGRFTFSKTGQWLMVRRLLLSVLREWQKSILTGKRVHFKRVIAEEGNYVVLYCTDIYISCLSRPLTLVAKVSVLYYAAAATTAIAGILHLVQAPSVLEFSLNFFIFFSVAGIAQIFWVVPMIQKWGRPWYLIGIGGTIVLIILFVITRMPGNPITGRGGPVSPLGLAIEVFEAAFIGLTIAVIVYEMKRKQLSGKTTSEIV